LARAGKSSSAQILAELYEATGRKAHVISLDGWLKPVNEGHEGKGVLARYNLDDFCATVVPIVRSSESRNIDLYRHYRSALAVRLGGVNTIDANDVIIVEGVVALMVEELVAHADTTVHVDISEDVRHERLTRDSMWRGVEQQHFGEMLRSRDEDEVPIVQSARTLASHIVTGEWRCDC
jgi:pantothenate kinase